MDALTAPVAQPLRMPPEVRRRTRPRTTSAGGLSSLLLGGVVLLVISAVTGMALGAWRFTVIDTGSMRPTLNPGDVAVLTAEPTTQLRTGQIIAFHPPGEPGLTVVHRVFSLRRTSSGVMIQTKGDANNAPDQWKPRIISATVWRERVRAPMLGYLAVWSQHRAVRLGVLAVIILVGVSLPLGWLWRSNPA